MIRDPGWHMIGAGRSLERALQVCHLLAATTTVRRGIDVDREVLNAVLVADRERGHPPAPLPRLRPPGRRARAAADRRRQPALARVRARRAARAPRRRCPARPARPAPSGCSPTCSTSSPRVDVAALVAIGGVEPAQPGALPRRLPSVALARLADAVAELHFASGPAPRPLGSLGSRSVGGRLVRYRVTPPHDVLLRRRRHRQPRRRPPGAARRCPGRRSPRHEVDGRPGAGRPVPRPRLLRQHRDVLPGHQRRTASSVVAASSEVEVDDADVRRGRAGRRRGSGPGRCSTRTLPDAWRATDFALPSARGRADRRGARRTPPRRCARAARSARRSPT